MRWKEFVEWLVVMCLWFPTAIGGWLVFFGLPLGWMSALTVLVSHRRCVVFFQGLNIPAEDQKKVRNGAA